MKTMRGLTTAFSLIAVLCLFGCSGNGVHDAGDEEQEDANLQPAFVLKSIDAHATIHDGSAVNVVQNIATMELDDRGNVIRAVYRNQDSGSDIVGVESEFDERGFPVGRIVEKKLSDETAGTVVTSTRFQCTPDGEGRLLSAEWESEVSFGSDKVTRASGVDRYSYSPEGGLAEISSESKTENGESYARSSCYDETGFLIGVSGNYEDDSYSKSCEYDESGRLVAVSVSQEGLGVIEERAFAYDDYGNLKSISIANAYASAYSFEYEYQKVENPSTMASILSRAGQTMFGQLT